MDFTSDIFRTFAASGGYNGVVQYILRHNGLELEGGRHGWWENKWCLPLALLSPVRGKTERTVKKSSPSVLNFRLVSQFLLGIP